MSDAGELRWAVKDSFLRYVRVIAAGTVTVEGGASEQEDGGFSWPLRAVRREDGALLLEFAGSVRFQAHAGFLDVDLREPRLRLHEGGGELDIAPESAPERLTIATIDAAGDALVPRLSEAGVPVFGNVYAVGTELAPLLARVAVDPGTGPALPVDS
ncbi:MAG: HtaA domain-containing protein [Microbacterium sp.]